jgi:hypothetical protein
MASNDNDKRKMEDEAESSTVRKCLWHIDDDGSNDDSSNSSDSPEEESPEKEPEEEETEEEVSLEETLMNQLDTSEEKLYARSARGYIFGDDNDTPLDIAGHTTHTGKSLAATTKTMTLRCG